MPTRDSNPERFPIERRKLLGIGAGAAATGLGAGLLSGSAAAWKRFDVDFRSPNEVWMIVGDDLRYDPPAVVHVIVDAGDGAECRLVEFTEDNATTVPDHYGNDPVVKYRDPDEAVLGVLPYNRPRAGKGRFSRPRCVMKNDRLDEKYPPSAYERAECVRAAVKEHWDGHFKECWFDPLDSEKDPIEDPDDRKIDSCTEITEPGEYELVTDLRPEEGETCLEIRAEGVTINGNGYEIDGSALLDEAETAGVLVDAVDPEEVPPGHEPDEVMIRDVHVAGWDDGIAITDADTTAVEDAVIRKNERGIRLDPDANLRLDGVTVERNDDAGVRSGGFNDVSIAASTIQNNGNGAVFLDTSIDIESSTVQDNDDTGLAILDSFGTIVDTTISGNGGTGLLHRITDVTLDGVTLSDNDGAQLGPPTPPEGAPLLGFAATDLVIGDFVTLEAENGLVSLLDVVDREVLPELSEGTTAIGDGLETVRLELPVSARFEPDVEPDETAELWRHDGTEWEVVEGASVVDGGIEATIEGDGVFAPVTDDGS